MRAEKHFPWIHRYVMILASVERNTCESGRANLSVVLCISFVQYKWLQYFIR